MISRWMAAAALCGVLTIAPLGVAQTNDQIRKDNQAQTKQQQKADKTQAKADKSANKAEKSSKVRKAAKDQDKANREASKVPPTPAPQWAAGPGLTSDGEGSAAAGRSR